MPVQSESEFLNLRLTATTAREFETLAEWCKRMNRKHRAHEAQGYRHAAGYSAESRILHQELAAHWAELEDLYRSTAAGLSGKEKEDDRDSVH